MITFKSTEDLAKLHPEDTAYPNVNDLVDRLISEYTPPGGSYNANDYGYVILIEEADMNRTLDEIWDGCRLLDIYWEGIMLRDGFFIAIYLPTTSTDWCSSSRTRPGRRHTSRYIHTFLSQ